MSWKNIIKQQDLENIGGELGRMAKDVHNAIDRQIKEMANRTAGYGKTSSFDSRAMAQMYGKYTMNVSSVSNAIERLRTKIKEIKTLAGRTGSSSSSEMERVQQVMQSGILSLPNYVKMYLNKKHGFSFNNAKLSGEKLILS